MGKWEKWYESQPEHIKQWLDQPRPIWTDKDLAFYCSIALVIGWAIGYLVR